MVMGAAALGKQSIDAVSSLMAAAELLSGVGDVNR
jgi:hypothetical protein